MRFDLNNNFDRERFKSFSEKLLSNRKKVELTEKKGKRTLSQNALFHLWIAVLADHIGEVDLNSVKRDLKRTLLGMREVSNRFTGERQMEDFSTSEMDIKELSDFMDKFKIWANTDFGCYLPYVGDPGYDQMIEMYNSRI